jgi:2-polyprenyl-6-methoxyphenol hydroxylase-like FAD-dependent oxidoreductase
VLIVGGGPVGLALAGDLGWRGVPSLLAERRSGDITQPKMDMVGVRTMEFCRRWGIVDWVESAGYNRMYPQDCAWVTSLNGYEFGRESFPPPAMEKLPQQSPQKRERCPQNFFDPVLTRFARRSGLADVRYFTELTDFEEQSGRVTARLRQVQTGEELTVAADYLVGCDGGASMVRPALGIDMSGEGVLTYTVNVVFRYAGLEDLHHLEPAYRYIFIGPEGTWATMVAINGRDQWRFSLIGDDSHREFTDEDIHAAIIRAVGRDFDFEILSVLPWVRSQLVADSYRRGRVFIAGDAAHLTSPTGGFGMNTGILDAVNLSWKLAATVQGWGGETLLESYEAEQRPVAIRNVNEAGDNLKRMLTPRIAHPNPLIFAGEGAEAEAARREYGDRYTEMMRREWFSIGIHLGYIYEESPVVVADGTPMPELTVSTYAQTGRPGSRAPHVWLADGRSLIDEYGLGFVLVILGEDAVGGDRVAELFRTAADHRGVPLHAVAVDDPEAVRLYGARYVLVRPDGSVAHRAAGAPDDAGSILDTARGAAVPAETRHQGDAERPRLPLSRL